MNCLLFRQHNYVVLTSFRWQLNMYFATEIVWKMSMHDCCTEIWEETTFLRNVNCARQHRTNCVFAAKFFHQALHFCVLYFFLARRAIPYTKHLWPPTYISSWQEFSKQQDVKIPHHSGRKECKCTSIPTTNFVFC